MVNFDTIQVNILYFHFLAASNFDFLLIWIQLKIVFIKKPAKLVERQQTALTFARIAMKNQTGSYECLKVYFRLGLFLLLAAAP